MPYLSIQSNHAVDEATRAAFNSKASLLVAELLGKPERYVMVSFAPSQPMCFAGTSGPCAYLELKSIGLPASRTAELSQQLCTLAESELGISADRIYIEFSDAPRAFWGWNGGTF